MDLRKLLYLKAAIPGDELVEATATGNPATFTTDVKKALKGLVIPFKPVQSGSGDPAPDNVRDITGWTGLHIYKSGEDTSNPDTITVSWQTEAGTVYGGSLNAKTGVLTVEYILVTGRWGDLPEAYSSETIIERILILNATTYGTADTGWVNTCACNVAKRAWAGTANETPHFYIGISPSYGTCVAYIYLPAATSDDITIKVAAKLKEPTTVQLDPVVIKTLIGKNNIWTDTTEDITVTYLKKST